MNRKTLMLAMAMVYVPLAFGEVTSQYTEVSDKTCTSDHPASNAQGEELDGGDLRCKGPNGYELWVNWGDNHLSVSIMSPDKVEHDLEVPHYYSSLKPRVEWRLIQKESLLMPTAVILPVDVEDTANPGKTFSYLAVARITKEKICITDWVRSIGLDNQKTRSLADSSGNKECLESPPSP